jgi:hypothetical protein
MNISSNQPAKRYAFCGQGHFGDRGQEFGDKEFGDRSSVTSMIGKSQRETEIPLDSAE